MVGAAARPPARHGAAGAVDEQRDAQGPKYVVPGEVAIEGLPTTIFINRAGKVGYVHTGQYQSQGTLNAMAILLVKAALA